MKHLTICIFYALALCACKKETTTLVDPRQYFIPKPSEWSGKLKSIEMYYDYTDGIDTFNTDTYQRMQYYYDKNRLIAYTGRVSYGISNPKEDSIYLIYNQDSLLCKLLIPETDIYYQKYYYNHNTQRLTGYNSNALYYNTKVDAVQYTGNNATAYTSHITTYFEPSYTSYGTMLLDKNQDSAIFLTYPFDAYVNHQVLIKASVYYSTIQNTELLSFMNDLLFLNRDNLTSNAFFPSSATQYKGLKMIDKIPAEINTYDYFTITGNRIGSCKFNYVFDQGRIAYITISSTGKNMLTYESDQLSGQTYIIHLVFSYY